jgi:mono/diheme cytochrome c family protein
MSVQMFRALAVTATLGVMGVSGAVLLANQTPESVFTEEQATAGRAAYAKHCASCHMPDLSGNTEIPPLAGAVFIAAWSGRSTKDLFDYSAEAMPYGLPSLNLDSYSAITAYILQANGGVAGPSALSGSTAVPISSVIAPQKTP